MISRRRTIPEFPTCPQSGNCHRRGEILRAIAPIDGRQPLKLVTRIEIAAAFLASACDCAFNSADAIGSPGEAPGLYAKTEELVLRRAQELYAQDGA
jgi:hypothetical protein